MNAPQCGHFVLAPGIFARTDPQEGHAATRLSEGSTKLSDASVKSMLTFGLSIVEIGRLDLLDDMSVAVRFSNGIKAKGPIKKVNNRNKNGLRLRFTAR
jgi:hypothetical protein